MRKSTRLSRLPINPTGSKIRMKINLMDYRMLMIIRYTSLGKPNRSEKMSLGKPSQMLTIRSKSPVRPNQSAKTSLKKLNLSEKIHTVKRLVKKKNHKTTTRK